MHFKKMFIQYLRNTKFSYLFLYPLVPEALTWRERDERERDDTEREMTQRERERERGREGGREGGAGVGAFYPRGHNTHLAVH